MEAENYDKGGEGVAYHDTANGGDTAYRADNIGVEAGSVSNGYDVTYTANGEWDGYTLSVASAGTYTLSAALSSSAAGGTFHLEFGPIGQVGGTGLTKSAEFTVPNTGGFSTFQTISTPGVSLPAGPVWMRLVIDSQYPCKFDDFTLVLTAAATPQPTPYSGSAVTVATSGAAKVEAENYDKGGEGVAYHDTANGGDTAYRADNIGVEAGSVSNGYDVTYTASGEWDGYTLSVASAGTYTLSAVISSTSAGGTFHLEFGPVGQVGGTGVAKTAEFTVPNTGSFSTYQTLSVPGMALPSGLLWMRLVIDSQYPCKFDDFTLAAVPTLTSIVVSPASAALNLNGTQQFSAVAKDQNGNALATQPTFTWSVASGVGTVSSAGLYSAGATAGSASVTAKSGSVTGTASVTVTNAAPTVATAAAASPASVTGTTTALSVLGADDGGEANLIYTWATTGTPPAAVSFSASGTNAAKSVTATFTKAGTYGFSVTIKDAGGLTATSSVSVTVSQTLTAIVVSPNPATLTTGGTQQFTAAASDQFGTTLTTQPTFTWSVASGVGTVTTAGLYSAGATAGTATVAAKSGTVTGTAAVTVNAPAAGISLALVSAVNNQASLSWSSVSGAASYNVKRSTTSGSGYTTVANVTTTSDLDQGLTNGTPYYYIVTAVSGTTESAPSNQVAATPTAQAFGFLNVGNGSVLSGEVTLSVSMASSNYGDENNSVHLQVDGQYYSNGGEFQTPVNGGATVNTSFVLDTQQYTNGSHTLTVSNGVNTSTINVVFNNYLSAVNVTNMFDPSGRNGEGTTGTISAVLASASSWTVSIYTTDNSKTLIKSWSGTTNTISVNWNGTNSTGTQMPGDAYEVDITTGMSSAGQTTTVTPNGQGQNNVYQSAINLIAGSDVFLWLDQDVFPQGYGSMMAYAHAIKADLAPSKGNVWNTMSMLIHTPHYFYRAADIAAINQHFSSPLTVFYFYGHGGLGLGGDKQFSCGNCFWHSGLPDSSWIAPYDSSIQQLTQNVGYGTNVNAPALVFIDSCKSGGDGNAYEQDDITFGDDFDIADVMNVPGGAYLGWAGCAIQYGAYAPPKDDWTFWRLDLWANFTNPNQTYDTDWSNLQRDLSNHGHNTGTEPDAQQVIDWYSNTSF